MTLIDPIEYASFFNRDQIYGYSDDFERSVKLTFLVGLPSPLRIFLYGVIHFSFSYFLYDAFRFSYFSRASLDYLIKSNKKPDVIHIHGWETSIVGPLFWDIFAKQVYLKDFHLTAWIYCKFVDGASDFRD